MGHIAFMALMPGHPWKIHLVSADGGPAELVLPGDRTEVDPGWAPDGRSPVFCRLPWFEAEGAGAAAIHFLDLKTRGTSTLPGSEGLFSPRFSPDGRFIVALSAEEHRLVLFDLETRKQRELLERDLGQLGYPNWSRDGRHVYFSQFSGDAPAVFRVGRADRRLDRLMELKGLRPVARTFGPWFDLAPDDSLLLLRDAGIQEVYALDWEAP